MNEGILRKILTLIGFFIAGTSVNAMDYYWVGGSGNWEDPQHWSIASGGQGGAGIPSGGDNVFFDQNSFTTHHRVKINGPVSINNFTNTSPSFPEISGGSMAAITVNGNWINTLPLKNNFPGTIHFSGNNNHQIHSNGVHFKGPVRKSGSGSLILQDDLILEGANPIILEEGDFLLNGNSIVAYTLYFPGVQQKFFKADHSHIVTAVPVGYHSANLDTSMTGAVEIVTPLPPPPNGGAIVRASNTCGSGANQFTITATVVTDYNGQDVSCKDSTNGTICVSISGGIGPFTIQWLGGGPNTSCWLGVGAGTYTVVVTDQGSGTPCAVNVVVQEPGSITVLSWTSTNPSCPDSCDGSATPFIFNGTTPYTYVWSSGETTATANELCVGLNTLEVTDVNGCEFDSTFFILTPAPLLSNVDLVHAFCFGSCDGSAVSNPSGGNGAPFTWSWSNGSTADSIGGLCAGTYTLSIQDNNGCPKDTTFSITQPAQIIITLNNITHLICNGVPTGSITISSSSGVAPHTYEWFDSTGTSIGQTDPTASGLAAGTYYVVVTDANGCTQQSPDYTVTQPTAITTTVSSTPAVCNGQCSGTLSVTSSGGTGTHTYEWYDASNPVPPPIATTANASNICPGTYFAVVTDANGCIVNSGLTTITDPPPLQLSINTIDAVCNLDCNGAANVASVSGGTGALTISWFDDDTVPPLQLGTGNAIANLCAGNYFGLVTDANGCTFSEDFIINEPTDFSFTVSTSNVSCIGTCNGTADVSNITGQSGNYFITWSTSGNTTFTETGLCIGTFSFTITDDNGCDTTHTYSINNPVALTISPTFTDPSCQGICDGTATANAAGGSQPYTYNWVMIPGGNVGNSSTISSLCDGDYSVTVTDSLGCTANANFTLTDPAGMTATITTTSSTCGVCDGTADATIIGGTAPFTVEWIDVVNGPTGIFGDPGTNMCAGNYYALITDANGCNVLSDTASLTDNVIITGTLIPTDPSCFGFCDGSIDLTVGGGTPPFTYQWFNSANNQLIQSGEDAIGLCDGTYYVIVTDSSGCTSVPFTETVTQPTDLTASASVTATSCFNTCDGTGTLTVSGGTTPYSFQWLDLSTGTVVSTVQNPATLCAGTYEVTVTDASGCSEGPMTVTVTSPPAITASVSSTDALCFGVCNGTATVTVSGGTAPYSFTWTGTAGSGSSINTLCVGSYSVTVTDNSGCVFGPMDFTINEPTDLTALTTDGSVLCAGACNGTVSVSASGGTTPYSYQWSAAANNQITPIASSLCAGSYTVTVTDANGCTEGPLTASVTEPAPLSAITSFTNATCSGTCDGTATASPAGGSGPYTFSWSDPLNQNTQTAINLCGGTYTVTITDANGCTITPPAINIGQPATLSLTVSSINPTCFGSCDGSATVSTNGGTAPFTIAWDDPLGQTTLTASNLCDGTYTVDVTDANGCPGSATVTLTEPAEITSTTSSTLAACGVCDGSATVTPSGGTGTLDILWDAAASNQTTSTATLLCAGIYNVAVTDDNGCSATFMVPVSNVNGEILTMDSTIVTCNGDCDGTATVSFNCSDPACTILWNNSSTNNTITNLCAGTYGVTVTNATGCISSATVQVPQPAVLTPNGSSTSVTCSANCNGTGSVSPTGGTSPYTVQWDAAALNQTTTTAFNLCAGSYVATVTDSNGCTANETVTITAPNVLSASVTDADVLCFGQCNGTATAFPTGGVPPYSYLWDDPAAQTTQQATGLCAGTYNVTVFDSSGCTFGPLLVTVDEPAAISASLTFNDLQCNGDCNGSASAVVSGGVTPYNYQWNDLLNQTTATATNLCAGIYDVLITDGNGCSFGPLTATLNEPDSLTASFIVTNNNCSTDCDGVIISSVSGGITPYTYLWDDPAGSTTPSIGNLCSGTYTMTVTDGNSCTQDIQATITSPQALTVTLTSQNLLCNSLCNGSITSTIAGGTAPYAFSWSSGETTQNLTNICAGTYTLTVTDANGCTATASRVITEPTAITFSTSSSNSSCGVCNGNANVSPSGGLPGYTYSWDAAAGNQTTQTATALCAGIYSVTVTDQNNCSVIASVGVSDIGAETVTVSGSNQSCFSICNGTATATTACVNGPCTYSWSEQTTGPIGQNTPTATGLCGGTYLVEVENAAGCITVAQIIFTEPTEIFANITSTNLACFGVCTGSATVNPSGGVGPYTILWSTSQTTGTISNLCAGTYTVQITDSTNCSITDTVLISQPQQLNITVNDLDALCAGDCNGLATAIVTGGITPYTYQWDDSNSQTGSSASSLCAGTYNVTVTDNNSCTISGSATINEPTALTAIVSSIDATCENACNGSGTASPSGGTTPYSYLWSDPGAQTIPTATGLCAGTYNVIVSDSNNCSTGPLPVTVNEPAEVTFTATSTNPLCNATCSGTISIIAAGGNGTYQYSINNGSTFQLSPNFTNLCAGSYTLLVTDGNNCTSLTQNININQPSILTATNSAFPADCNIDNGTATINPAGATPPYTFQWSAAAGNQTTQTAIGLGAGIYSVVVTDANGCTGTFSVTVPNANAPTVTGTSTNATCNGSCNGSIDITVTGGTPGYSYNWVPGGETTEDLSNLCAGGYLIQVTDASGCIDFLNFSITQPGALGASFVTADATCGQCDGSATVTATGGNGSYSYDWTNGDTTATAAGLCSGAYMVLITDSAGCSESFNTGINNTGGPTGENVVVNNVSCNGLCDGDATVSPIGGTAPYEYYWIHNNDTINSADSLCAGEYFLEVTDSNGCIRITSVIIPEPLPFADSTVVTAATCGGCDGSLDVMISGGSGPYTYQWDVGAGGGTASSAINLCEGIYNVIVTDNNGCSDTLYNSVSGNNAPQLVINSTDASCEGVCDGTADATANFGTAPFMFTWLDETGTATIAGGTPVTGLCAGNYILQVVDAAGCTAFEEFTIDEPDSMLFSLPFLQNPSCFNTCDGIGTAIVIQGTLPYTFSWNDPAGQTSSSATALCSGTYTVTVTDGNGCSQQQTMTLVSPPAITLALDSTDASCSTVPDGAINATAGGGTGTLTYSWSGPNFSSTDEDLTNIYNGTYVLTVTDANGCSLTDSIVVGAILVVNANAGNDTSLCANLGSVLLTGSGGNTYEWYDLSGNLLSSDSTLQTTLSLGTSTYVLVANVGGCLDSDTVDVTTLALPDVDAGEDDEILAGTSTTIGGNPTTTSGNTVIWTPDYFLSDTLAFNPVANPDSSTTYIVQAIDPNGCVSYDTVFINVLPDITFPNGFSNNGDGVNDVWEIDFISLFPDCQVEIYNRWGQLLFLSVGYDTPWDGNYNNQPVPVGTYYYIINLNHPLYPDVFTGPLTVVR